MSAVGTPPDSLREALERALGAQYEVIRLLGRGGMGAVYLARERLLERLVAIKVLPSDNADADARERFLREARTAAQLSHPNIVPLLSFGEMSDTLFYIMRYVEGESLETKLRREGKLSPDDARRILSEIAAALAEAHRLGIVHRDVKPDNVMIESATGRAMLTDFGIARHVASKTLTGSGLIVGSPQYMSPEQASGDRVLDGRSDLYSLGVLGYRMLAGRLPFTGASVHELVVQQITAEAPPITAAAPDVPIDIADAITRCLAKDPAQRWGDAEALQFALSARSDIAALPDALDGVPSGGTRAIAGLLVADVGLVGLYAYTKDPEWLAMAAGISVFGVVVPMISVLLQTRKAGLSWRRVLPIAFWPTPTSFLWWPRIFRRPGDVFDRLPATVKRGRILQTIGVGMMTLLAVPQILGAAIAGEAHWAVRKVLVLSGASTIVAGVLVIAAAALMSHRWKRLWKLSTFEADKLLAEPTHGSRFWERPAVAAMLASRPAQTADAAQAIRELAAGLPDNSIAQEASDAATELAKELRSLDERIRELAGQVDPAELQRVEARLAALGPERADEPDVGRQMRALLRGQATLFAELGVRRTELEKRRERLQEQLRMLWLQMVNYRAQVVARSDDAMELSGRIRDLCRSIERRVSAADETANLVR